jgi:enoyl-CoA hydratase/carnithine racemase
MMQSDSPLRVEKVSTAYWRATFDNPPLNLFGAEIHKALQSLLAQAETDDELRVLVFDTANPDYYIAHFDMLGGDDVLAIKTASRLPVWPDSASRMSRLDVITVASIRGRARGIGSEFVLACDIRFASREKAVLGQPEVSVGVIPGGGGLDRLPGLVGRGRALEIVAGADDFDAELAERYGWVNRAVPDAELDAFVDNFADRLASFDKKALAKAKFIINDRQPVPTAGKLAESEAAFFETTTWPSTQQRVAAAFERGLQAPGPFEDNLGAAQANLGAELGK